MYCQFSLKPYVLQFSFDAGTSRGVLKEKQTWFILAQNQVRGSVIRQGIGEASPLRGLSFDFSENYEEELQGLLSHLEKTNIPENADELSAFLDHHVPLDKPSMRFGIECALLSLISSEKEMIISGDFFNGQYRIPINGLIWMGDEQFMKEQINDKLIKGFSTIKMKIGAIDFDTEFKLLEGIRREYDPSTICLRVDANGAFNEGNVREVLEKLASLGVHSIEQPIMPGQPELMKRLCQEEILPIALDEELIGKHRIDERIEMLDFIQPQFIILKPSLIGGIRASKNWIDLAEERNIGWWITSMLESNVGLNAISQLAASYKPGLPQGLGTGQLYTNNIDSPLQIRKGELVYNAVLKWDYSSIIS